MTIEYDGFTTGCPAASPAARLLRAVIPVPASRHVRPGGAARGWRVLQLRFVRRRGRRTEHVQQALGDILLQHLVAEFAQRPVHFGLSAWPQEVLRSFHRAKPAKSPPRLQVKVSTNAAEPSAHGWRVTAHSLYENASGLNEFQGDKQTMGLGGVRCFGE